MDFDYPPLDPLEERKLLIDYHTNDNQEAKEKLILHNLALVAKIVKNFERRIKHGTHDDLFQEGVTGLIEGIDRFDINKKKTSNSDDYYKLSTYATYWIFQKLNRYIELNRRLIRIPEQLLRIIRKCDKHKDVLDTHEIAYIKETKSRKLQKNRLDCLNCAKKVYYNKFVEITKCEI